MKHLNGFHTQRDNRFVRCLVCLIVPVFSSLTTLGSTNSFVNGPYLQSLSWYPGKNHHSSSSGQWHSFSAINISLSFALLNLSALDTSLLGIMTTLLMSLRQPPGIFLSYIVLPNLYHINFHSITATMGFKSLCFLL